MQAQRDEIEHLKKESDQPRQILRLNIILDPRQEAWLVSVKHRI
jgi:hypothetical protein